MHYHTLSGPNLKRQKYVKRSLENILNEKDGIIKNPAISEFGWRKK